MKLILLIFIICVNYSLCDREYQNVSKKIILKSYPKKVGHSFPQFHEAGKYFKTVEEKVPGSNKDFTTFPKPFPKAQYVEQQIVPDSPYFPVDAQPPKENRARVKKMLPSFSPLLRRKRSADDEETDKKAEKAGKSKPSADKNEDEPEKLKARRNSGHKPRTGKKKSKRDLSLAKNKNASGKQKLSNPRNQKKKLSGSRQKSKLSAASRMKAIKSNNADLTKKKVKRIAPPRQERKRQKLSKTRNRTFKKNASRSRSGLARRLIAGKEALIEQYPYVVSIQKDKQHWCSGALLNPRLVMTTANCLWRSTMVSRMRVRAGSRHTDRGGQVAKIQEVMKHPGWKIRRNPDNDIAFIVLDRNIRFSHSCHGIDLPNRVMMPAFDDAWVTSWGSDRSDGIYDMKDMSLQSYHARLLDRDKCSNITQRFGVSVSENFICLAQTGRRAPCTRDTGAPAVSDGILWGLASWGIRKFCGTERYPAMFSYLASQSNMDFITNATRYLMSDERQYPYLDRFPVPKVGLTARAPMTLPY